MRKERDLYKRRSKSEAEYLKVLANYDKNVGALHHRMENLTDRCNQLTERLKIFQEELAIQKLRYVELKEERELIILKAFTENLENFKHNRAARIIQRFWRNYYERWSMRKKKKSKKKKK
ncbi:dynein regulatory complex protein 10-like isoform X2 [Venturia canescens]|uniref:dynein regulatory complex protein 10-like isoform X2 n=1 Tax=Venturia canescens TaxID=32260 RepID=UPI001C9D3100|nr:dynein regulatory complex protein 10-like isoform X2 [Venturia canescens]XP_043278274.1 dynein regulatory complex protein 10-like isoform X2 [Venturia canescens]